jgi:hypothetical protein
MWGGTTVRSYPPEKLQDVYRTERRDGTGNVVVARKAWRDTDGDRHSEELGFLRVRDPKGVEALLKDLPPRPGRLRPEASAPAPRWSRM